MQRTSSDEGNFTPARSPVEEDSNDLLSNALLDEIETLVRKFSFYILLSC